MQAERYKNGRLTVLVRSAPLVIVLALFCGSVVPGASGEMNDEKALGEYYDWQEGKRLYHQYCRFCHGEQGKGHAYGLVSPPPADLTDPAVQMKSDADLSRTIHEGESGSGMGAWKWALSEQEQRHVLLYIRWLARSMKTDRRTSNETRPSD